MHYSKTFVHREIKAYVRILTHKWMKKIKKCDIIIAMHKAFYASGFLYHPPTQQILLQQKSENDLTLTTFGGEGMHPDTPEEVFHKTISDKLGIRIPKNGIYRVYDYLHESMGKQYFLVYAEYPEIELNFKLKGIQSVGWFPFKQVGKLKLTQQIRQDIIVGQRVINLAEREKMESELPEETNPQR